MLSAALQSVQKVARPSSWRVLQQQPVSLLIPAAQRSFGMQTHAVPPRADAVLSYWFGPDYAQQQPVGYWSPEDKSKLWFKGGPEVDRYITEHFAEDIKTLAAGGYDDWIQTPMAAVAGIVLADQFTRNVYRGSAQMYALDDKALQWLAHVRKTSDVYTELPSAPLRHFAYMPLMHSEELQDQQTLVQLIDDELASITKTDPESAAAKNWADVKRFAEAHMRVVERWGRFPHRNALLGRPNTPEEEAGLKDGSIPAW